MDEEVQFLHWYIISVAYSKDASYFIHGAIIASYNQDRQYQTRSLHMVPWELNLWIE